MTRFSKRRKKMKKLAAAILALILALSLAACGGSGTDTPVPAPTERATPTPTPTPTPAPATPVPDDTTAADDSETAGEAAPPDVEPSPFDSLPEAPESDFRYKFDSETGGMMITGYEGDWTEMRLPALIEDEPVTAIGEGAFHDSGMRGSSFKIVYIPEGVVAIGAGAFQNCRALTDISLPEGLTTIGAGTFFYCSSLTEITIPDSVEQIEGAIFGAFGVETIAVSYKGFVYKDNEVVTAIALKDYGYESIEYGGYNWFVLERAEGKALLFSIGSIESRPYDDEERNNTWADCSLREYLNSDFYYSIAREDRERIAETELVNNDNPWYDTAGGEDTTDKIFLLSIEEVVKYFGDSGQLANRPSNGRYPASSIDDEFNAARMLPSSYPWRLRSPGRLSIDVACIAGNGSGSGSGSTGSIYVSGVFASFGSGSSSFGVRPALWLNLE
jgi:hypothetical protein